MQLLNLFLIPILSIACSRSAVSASMPGEIARRNAEEIAVGSDDSVQTSTTYNGVEVPPMPMLNGETFNDDIKTGYW